MQIVRRKCAFDLLIRKLSLLTSTDFHSVRNCGATKNLALTRVAHN